MKPQEISPICLLRLGFVLVFFCLITGISPLKAQNPPLSIPYEFQSNHELEQQIRESGDTLRHTAVKPFLQSKFGFEPTQLDQSLRKDHWFFRKLFYEHLIDYQGKGFSIQLDPLFEFGVGREFTASKTTWINTRGLQIQANIGSKIAFYTSVYENQAMMPVYIDRFIQTWTIKPVVPGVGIMPGQGIVREFGSSGGWDYGNATGYVSYSPNKFLNFQFGHDRHFIGHGYRSLLLSDATYPAPYFRLQLDLGPVQYTYWLMQYTDPGAQPISYNVGFRKKYASYGYLNWQINDKIQIGAFQALIWPGDDSIGGSRPPSWQYMNPFIFIHPVHYGNGSEGNYFVGLNGQWEFVRNYFLYGQLMFDELKVKELLKNSGAAANKYGAQIGLKSGRAFGLSDLFLQAELNLVRPYTFSHMYRITNYSHYLQPIGHPSGANFREFLLLGDYRFRKNWYLSGKLVYSITGLDFDTTNYGGNIFRSYLESSGGADATGIYIGQGEKSTLMHTEFALGYLINPKTNMRIEVKYIYREQGPESDRLTSNWFQIGFRTSLRNLYYDF
jgi:hypothetical protein